MNHSCVLLCRRQAVQEIVECHFVLILGGGSHRLAVVAYLFTANNNGPAISTFGKGQDIVIPEAYPLPDLMGDGDPSPLAKDTVHLFHSDDTSQSSQ